MSVNGASVYGTFASPFKMTPWGRCTRKDIPGGVRLYLHVFNWPASRKLEIPGCLNEPLKAYLLADPKMTELKTGRKDDALILSLPALAPDQVNSVVVLDLKGKLDLTDPPEILSGFDFFVDSIKVTLHYTLDGTNPTINSEEYSHPFTIYQSAFILARCFRSGNPVSGTGKKNIVKVTPYPASSIQYPGSSIQHPSPGISFRYFEGDWDSIPDFSKLNPVKSGEINNFIFTSRNQDERFAFVFQGLILIPSTDVYAFYTESDDGSKLFIDDKLVVNNDGLHGMKEQEGTIALKKGHHKIRVEYFEKTGSDDLRVSWRSNQFKKQVVPVEVLFH
jgi:hypothetical protein